MDTPICDFVRHYAETSALRLHMPGHKGFGPLGVEQLDITEISGADSLYEADGIIAQSERNAGSLFGCQTFYSTEGSSQCIRAMLHLASLQARKEGKRPLIAAARNVHKTFLSAAALLGLDVAWLDPEKQDNYLSCKLDAPTLDAALENMAQKPTAVYLTSPDYLGNVAPIREISEVCRKYGALLLVDNAHGAYLRFLDNSMHPMDLGADLCCDSAHKTLPVLTGGAYLHTGSTELAAQAKNALALFGSTSPSYLILQSLDAANAYLAEAYRQKLTVFTSRVQKLKRTLLGHGYTLLGDEPLKLTIAAKSYGYEGTALAELLQAQSIVCEFADPDHLVLMLTPEIGEDGLQRLEKALLGIVKQPPIASLPPAFRAAQAVMPIRDAVLAPSEMLPVHACLGRVLGYTYMGCPPAVPIACCGERIDEHTLTCFRYYGITQCRVVCE